MNQQPEEYNDVYDENRNRTGRVHLRGTPWDKGDYGLIVCVWVYDGKGHLLMTRRAPEKSAAGTWENSGGAAKAGETSRMAVARELWEETGIAADEREFEYIESERDGCTFYDFYSLKRNVRLEDIVLLPGETDGVKWVGFSQVWEMIHRKEICDVIADQYKRQEPYLKSKLDESTEDSDRNVRKESDFPGK